MALTKKANDRRRKFRFNIEREIRYKLVEEGVLLASGTGHTLNLCSGGVAFSTEQALPPRAFAELSISWPILLDETCPMRLIVFGRILRSGDRNTVCSIDKYEFRTQARTFQPANAVRSDSMLQRWAYGMRKESVKTSQPGA
jgi:hypothetical protein